MSTGASVTILLLLIGVWYVLLVLQLYADVSVFPVTTYQCVRQDTKKRLEEETSSSEIRIESDEGAESSEIADSNVVSTKTYRHRDRVDTGEMDGDAGLEI